MTTQRTDFRVTTNAGSQNLAPGDSDGVVGGSLEEAARMRENLHLP